MSKWHLILIDGENIVKENEFPDYDACIQEGWIWAFMLVRRSGDKAIDEVESKQKYEIYPVADEDYEEFVKKFHRGMTLEEVKKNCREGWIVNPNEKIVNGILRGINKNDGQCPCQNDSEDKHCPCSNYRELDKCCCRLYLEDDNFEPLKVGDECAYYDSILSGTVYYNCVVEKVEEDGKTYHLKEIPQTKQDRELRVAIFKDNALHRRAYEFGAKGLSCIGHRGLDNIRRKQ